MNCKVCKKELSNLEWFNFESGLICQQCYSIVLSLEQESLIEEGNQSFIRLQHFSKQNRRL